MLSLSELLLEFDSVLLLLLGLSSGEPIAASSKAGLQIVKVMLIDARMILLRKLYDDIPGAPQKSKTAALIMNIEYPAFI